MDDLPPLEPLSSNSGMDQMISSASNRHLTPLSVLAVPTPQDNGDVGMPPAIDPAFNTFVQPTRRDDDNNSMPGLQSVSDSSSESDDSVDEVEMMPDLRPASDDEGSTWATDVEDNGMPPLEPITGNRRARVADDEDEDRDRRHPTERTGNNAQGNAGPQRVNPPPFFAGVNPPRTGGPQNVLEMFQTFMVQPPQPPQPPTAPGANANPGANRPDQNQNAPPDIHLTFDLGNGVQHNFPPGPNDGDQGGDLPPAWAEVLFGNQGDGTGADGGNPLAPLRQLLDRLGLLGAAFRFQEEEKEDPERAKILVAGLEVVPDGLVRRMEKVGGAPGGHVDESTGEVESPGCAICWDTLLDQEGEGFKVEGAKGTHSHTDGEAASDAMVTDEGTGPSSATAETSGDPPSPTTTSPNVDSNPPAESKAPEEDPFVNKIVALPCAHVFHASCLIPWFSRPRQTTCPTCRFNIDPENLTYVPRPREQGPQPGQPGAAADNGPAPRSVPTNNAAPPAGNGNDDGGPEIMVVGGTDIDGDLFHGVFRGMDQAPFPANPSPSTTTANPVPPANPPLQVNPPPQVNTFGAAAFGLAPGANGQGIQFFGPFPLPAGQGQPFGNFMPPFATRPMQGQGPIPGMPPQGAQPAPQTTDSQDLPHEPPQDDQPGSERPHIPRRRSNSQPVPDIPRPHRTRDDLLNNMQIPGIDRITVDFRLFANNPFEGASVRRQTHVFTDQVFVNGGVPGGPAPAPAPAPVPGNGGPGMGPGVRFGVGRGGIPPGFPFVPPPTQGGDRPNQMPFPPLFVPSGPGARRPNQPREKKPWTLPPAPGPSLRSRVEEREREVGLRCSDISCGIGPSDEDPFPDVSGASLKQISIRPLPDSTSMNTSVCSHTFHSSCLVSAERVASWGGEEKEEERVEVSCPKCRTLGCVSGEDWEEGVQGLA